MSYLYQNNNSNSYQSYLDLPSSSPDLKMPSTKDELLSNEQLMSIPSIGHFPSKAEFLDDIPEETLEDILSPGCTSINTKTMKIPTELIFNEDKSTKTLYEDPFLVYDILTNVNRPFSIEDGYLYYMTRAIDSEGKTPKLFYLLSITIFSESYSELQDTIKSVYRNLKKFAESGISPSQCCMVVVFDGVQPISKEIRKKIFNKLDKEYNVPSHLTLDAREKQFIKDTDKISMGQKPDKPYYSSSYVYEWNYGPNEYYEESKEQRDMNHTFKILLSVKLRNAQKLSSIVWFFRGYCELFMPKYCSLMDCGTIPFDDSIWKKIIAFENNPTIGGACGNVLPAGPSEIDEKDLKILNQYDCVTRFLHKTFDIRKAQIFEYIFGHIAEKSFEGLLGINYVLPGCYSTFRWEAIIKRQSKLMKYEFLDSKFVRIVLDPYYKESDQFSIEEANMCLAEDQVLTTEIYTKMGCNYITAYIPDAFALTDAVKTFPVLLKQRKRWMNGSWYAFFLILQVYFKKMHETTHSTFQKCLFHFYIINQIVAMLNRWFMLAFSFSVVYLICVGFFQFFTWNTIPLVTSQFILFILFVMSIYFVYHMSLFYKLDQQIKLYLLSNTILGFIMHIFNFVILTNIYTVLPGVGDAVFENYFVFAFFTFFLIYYIGPLFLNYRVNFKEAIKSAICFLFHYPSFSLYFSFYSFCNISDLTWGTKAKEKESNINKLEKNKIKNGNYATMWLLSNILTALVSIALMSNKSIRTVIISLYASVYGFVLVLKVFGATIHKIKYDYWDFPSSFNYMNSNKKIFDENAEKMEKFIEDQESKVPRIRKISSPDKKIIIK